MNINIKNNEVKYLIKKLENDNINIYNIVKDINNAYKKLDSSKWKSNEKEKLDNNFNKMIADLDKNLLHFLNKGTDVLKLAVSSYENADLENQKNLEQL